MILWNSFRSFHPVIGLLSGLALTAACIILPVGTLPGRVALACLPVVVVVLVLPSPKTFLHILAFALMIYGPMALILPLPIVLQGAMTTVVAALSVGTLGYPALHDAVAFMPLPGILKLLLLQILHQASMLVRETAMIRRAMVVRGAMSRGRVGWQFLHALPRVWIPRVIFKANRVAHALEVRGYGMPVLRPQSQKLRTPDLFGMLAGAVALFMASAFRWFL